MARKVLSVLGVLLLAFSILFTFVNQVLAEQRLLNGDFEQGTANWSGAGFSTTGCPPRTGASAVALTTSVSEQSSTALQTITGFINPGTYTLTGFARTGSGAPSGNAYLSWRNPSNQEIKVTSVALPAGAAYAPFTVTEPSPPPSATRLIVRFVTASAGASTVCLDDLSLEGPSSLPPASTFTPTATATSTLTQTPLATATQPLPTATNTSVVQASATPSATAQPGATATSVSTSMPSQTPVPTSTPGPGAPTSLQFVNGSFEEGLRGWYRYGGDLQTVSSPARSGGAGALSSSTTSTKWAYQVVNIDPSLAYEFAGFLRSGGGIKSVYLRISWYDSLDGSGRALSTDDSTRLTNTGDTFAFVSTGGIAPPATARSARLRVMLSPEGAGGTVVYLDDFSFVTTVASRTANRTADPDEPAEAPVPTATPQQSDTPAPTRTPSSADETPTTSASAANQTPRQSVTPPRPSGRNTTSPSPVAETLALRSDGTPAEPTSGPSSEIDRPGKGNGTPFWAVGVVILLVSVGGSYWLAKHPVS